MPGADYPSNFPTMSYYTWKTLFDAAYPDLCGYIRSWNLQFPTKAEARHLEKENPGFAVAETFTRAYKRRIKAGEEKTIINLFRLWCKQTADKINSGEMVITNIVDANGQSARDGKASSSGTNAHLGKAAYTGFLRGEEDTEAITYKDQFIYPEGKGFGVRPLKNFRGTTADYQLLIHPDFLPVKNLPKGISFLDLESFEPTLYPYQAAQPLRIRGYKIENLHQSKVTDGNLRNKEISQKASEARKPVALGVIAKTVFNQGTASENFTADLAGATDGNPANVEGESSNASNVSPEINKNFSGAAAPDLLYRDAGSGIQVKLTSEDAFRRLFMAGQQIAAFAVLLIQSYLKKIAPAMGREYFPTEIKRGLSNAMELLAGIPEPELSDSVDRFCLVIDHMAQWIRLDPDTNFVLPPSRWFSLQEKANIIGAETYFLKPWEATGKEFEDGKKRREKIEAARKQNEEQTASLSNLHYLAWRMKVRMMQLHPTDSRLKSADLDKWTIPLKMMIRQDKHTFSEIVKVATWLIESKSKSAAFWRKETAGRGLRSTSGFRRNYLAMRDQMQAEQVRNRNYTETPKYGLHERSC